MEEIGSLSKEYQEYHSNNESKITKELLVKHSREFLTTVKPEERFMHLNLDFYEDVLEKITQKFESNEESIQKITAGFHSLEKYGVNLWKFPWRKEYQTIKLYTAFFKYNIEQQLRDSEAIFDILKSLGYTVAKQREVSMKEPDRERVIWTSLNLFLAQVDLQVIKEIMDNFSSGEFSLKEIVSARSTTRTVETAVYYLRKGAKRRKMEEAQADALSHGRTKDTHIGRVETFNNLQSDARRSDVVASADQTSRRPAKLSVLSKGRGDVTADTDFSSTGSAVSRKDPSVDAPTEYKVLPRNTGGHYFPSMNTEQLGQVSDQDLYGVSHEGSQPYGWTQYNPDARHSTVPQTRPSQYYINTHRYHTVAATTSHALSHHGRVPPSHSMHQYSSQSDAGSARSDATVNVVVGESATVAIADTRRYQSKNSSRTETQVRGSASGDARYANVGIDINSSTNQQIASTEFSTKESAKRHDDSGAQFRQTYGSGAEPMEVGQIERRKDAFSHYNGMAEAANENGTGQTGLTELNATMKLQLILEPGDGLPGKASKKVSSASTEHRGQCGSENIASAQDTTRFRDGATRQAQPSRSLYQNESDLTSSKVDQKIRSSAADSTSPTAQKDEEKRPSPVPSRRISTQREEIPSHQRPLEAQNPGQSSKNDRQTEVLPNARAALSKRANTSKHGGKVDQNACEMCMLQGISICRNCFLFVCGKCKEFYNTDLCEATKGEHKFKDLKRNSVQGKKSEIPSQHYENVDEGIGNNGQDWSCSRCTFLNPADNKICVMCATTRGVGPVELPEPGSRVCIKCTFHNKENAKTCKACLESLDEQKLETSV